MQVNPWTTVPILSFSLYLLITSCIKWWVIVCLPSRIFTLDVGLHMGRIAFLSPTVIVLFWVVHLVVKLSYDGLWSSILFDVSGPVVDRYRGLRKVKIRWGRWLVCGWFLLESACDTPSVTVAPIMSQPYPWHVWTVKEWNICGVQFEIQFF
jgi:hypothetical protein